MFNISLRLATSLIIFVGSIAFSYFTHVGWWAFGGTLFYASYQIDRSSEGGEIASYFALGLGIVFYFAAIVRMGWSF